MGPILLCNAPVRKQELAISPYLDHSQAASDLLSVCCWCSCNCFWIWRLCPNGQRTRVTYRKKIMPRTVRPDTYAVSYVNPASATRANEFYSDHAVPSQYDASDATKYKSKYKLLFCFLSHWSDSHRTRRYSFDLRLATVVLLSSVIGCRSLLATRHVQLHAFFA